MTFNNPAIPIAQPHLRIGGKLICRQFIEELRTVMSAKPYCKYLQQKLKWTTQDLTNVHWTAFKTALHSFPPNDQRQILLFINDKLPLRGSKVHPHQGSLLCPSCLWEPESEWHFLKCTQIEQKNHYTELKGKLMQLTQALKLHPWLFTAIWLGLNAIQTDTQYHDIIDKVLPALWVPIHSQDRLGWDQLYQGCFSKDWAQAINNIHLNIPQSGKQILIMLIKVLWHYILDIWTICHAHLHKLADTLDAPNYKQAATTLMNFISNYPQKHKMPSTEDH